MKLFSDSNDNMIRILARIKTTHDNDNDSNNNKNNTDADGDNINMNINILIKDMLNKSIRNSHFSLNKLEKIKFSFHT